MAEVTMPRLSDTMEEGTIASWLKKPGEQVNKGDVIAQIETDKATMDLTAFEAGTLQEILAPEGTTVAIGKPLARIGSGAAPAAPPSGGEASPPAAEETGSETPESSEARANVSEEPEPTAEATPAAAQTGGGTPQSVDAEATPAAAQTGEGAPPTSQATPASAQTPDATPPATNAEATPAAAQTGDAKPRTANATPAGAQTSDATLPATNATPTAAQRGDGAQPAANATPPSGQTGDGTSAAKAEAKPAAAQTGDGTSAASAEAKPAAAQTRDGATPARGEDGAADGKVRASPMARHIAAEHGLNLSDISGSGPQGRVVRADVEAALSGAQPAAPAAEGPPAEQAAAEQPPAEQADSKQAAAERPAPAPTPAPAADGDERVQLSQMRRTIARRLAESKRTVPHFYLTSVVDATDLGALRKQINEQTADAGIKLSFNDLIVKGAALAIRKVPDVNVSFADDALIRHSHVNVGIAVATERGLIVPVIRDADQKSVGQIAREAHDLAERANAGKLQPNEYSGGTFSISNLGMFGVDQFEAVINPPEAAILAVGAITREPAEHEGDIALRDRLRLTLSVDHRALDGAIGARYLQALKALLEKPMLLLV